MTTRTKSEWEALRREANTALSEIESRERDERNKKLLGKCFKYRNSYGADDLKWWLYMKVIGIEDGELVTHTFEESGRGIIEIKPRGLRFNISDGYKPITEMEFAEAWADLQCKISGLEP